MGLDAARLGRLGLDEVGRLAQVVVLQLLLERLVGGFGEHGLFLQDRQHAHGLSSHTPPRHGVSVRNGVGGGVGGGGGGMSFFFLSFFFKPNFIARRYLRSAVHQLQPGLLQKNQTALGTAMQKSIN